MSTCDTPGVGWNGLESMECVTCGVASVIEGLFFLVVQLFMLFVSFIFTLLEFGLSLLQKKHR